MPRTLAHSVPLTLCDTYASHVRACHKKRRICTAPCCSRAVRVTCLARLLSGGTQFSDPYGTWNNVVVQAIFKITLQEHYATIHLNANKIQLESSIICILLNTFVEYGQTFLDTLPNEVCNFNKYEIIYKGPANKRYDNTTGDSETFYSLTTEDITFVLAEKTRKPVCSYVLIQTEHPKLLIFETRPGNSFLENKNLEVQNMDIFTHVNSFIYVSYLTMHT